VVDAQSIAFFIYKVSGVDAPTHHKPCTNVAQQRAVAVKSPPAPIDIEAVEADQVETRAQRYERALEERAAAERRLQAQRLRPGLRRPLPPGQEYPTLDPEREVAADLLTEAEAELRQAYEQLVAAGYPGRCESAHRIEPELAVRCLQNALGLLL
jgi:hypothetical protein